MDRKNRLKRMMGGEVGNLTEEDISSAQTEVVSPDSQEEAQRKLIESIRNPRPNISEEDESTKANNPRNWLAGKVNPMLQSALGEDTKFQIPEMTVADEKRWAAELPEQMAGQGSMKVIPSSRFGNILQIGGNAPKQGLGKVTVLPSAADKVAAKNAANMAKKTELDADRVRRVFREKYGDTLAEKKKEWTKMADDPAVGPDKANEWFSSWVQEMVDKIRRGD